MTPALRMSSGSWADRSASELTETDGAASPAGSPLSESDPQALITRAATPAVARPSFRRTFTASSPLTPTEDDPGCGALARGIWWVGERAPASGGHRRGG